MSEIEKVKAVHGRRQLEVKKKPDSNAKPGTNAKSDGDKKAGADEKKSDGIKRFTGDVKAFQGVRIRNDKSLLSFGKLAHMEPIKLGNAVHMINSILGSHNEKNSSWLQCFFLC